jgi:hypothetical protein
MGSVLFDAWNAGSPADARTAPSSRSATATTWSIRVASYARSSAKSAGNRPMRMSMISPTPFCPSFDPCAKDTPLHVATRIPRIQPGGRASPFGGANSSGDLASPFFAARTRSPASVRPKSGETTSDSPISPTLCQFTPARKACPARIEFASPTPTIAPINVCELDAGRPKYHVPKFHRIAETRSARTIAIPAPLPLCTRSSAGKSFVMLIATAMPPSATPEKLQIPDQITATCGRSVFV